MQFCTIKSNKIPNRKCRAHTHTIDAQHDSMVTEIIFIRLCGLFTAAAGQAALPRRKRKRLGVVMCQQVSSES